MPMDFNQMTLLIAGIILVTVGLYIISSKRNRIEVVISSTSKGKEKQEDKKDSRPKREIVRKVPIEDLNVPEGFPNEVVFYYGS